MPRRKKSYIGPNKTLVNGGRSDPTSILPALKVNEVGIAKKVIALIRQYDELAQLDDRDQFISDLVDECAWAQTMRLDHLSKGTHTKPEQWTSQILAAGLAKVMRKHGLKAAISDYEATNAHRNASAILRRSAARNVRSMNRNSNTGATHFERRRSLYLRLIPGLSMIAGVPIPDAVKNHALRAKRIKINGF